MRVGDTDFDISWAYFHRGRNHMAILPKVRSYFRPGFAILGARRKSLWVRGLLRRVSGSAWNAAKCRAILQNTIVFLNNDGRHSVFVVWRQCRGFIQKQIRSPVHAHFVSLRLYVCTFDEIDVAKKSTLYPQIYKQFIYVDF